MKKLLHIVLFSLCISLMGNAQELQKNYINYQGVASDASGDAIASSTISIQIALKFGSATATASYIENHSVTTDAIGVFSLQIGNGSIVSGTYNATDWGTEASYITVSLNGTEVGTTEMVAVPYAMSSGDTQWAISGTDIENKNTGAVKVLTDLEVTGSISTQTGATINEFSTDGTLAGNSDTALSTEKAVKTYVDNATNGAVMSIDDLSDGKADAIGSLFLGLNAGANDDGTDNRNVGVGYQALQSNTEGSSNTANGYQALLSNTTGNNNTANGRSALYSNTTGNYNTASGALTLNNNTTGIANTANGFWALFSNTTGSSNTANGYAALYTNTTGENNTANGLTALFSNTTGNNNTANGYQALNLNTTGNNNTANGHSALFSNTTGNYNTASGALTLNNNTTGIANTANGFWALFSNTTGSSNTANGYAALYTNTTGENNTANGLTALFSNTTGSDNTANGYQALNLNTTGYDNSANGSQVLQNNTTGRFNTANGKQALRENIAGESNTAIGNIALRQNTEGNYNTAIGGDALRENITGDSNTAMGRAALLFSTTGNNNTAIGYNALRSNITGSGNVALGQGAGYNETGSNKLYIANSDINTPLIYGEFDNQILNLNGKTTVYESTNLSSTHAISGVKTHTGNNDAAGVYGENTVSNFWGYGVYGLGGYRGVYGKVEPTGSDSYTGVYGNVAGGTGTNYGVYGSASSGTTNYGVYAAGDLAYTGALISTSDQKLKTNINKLSNGMATIMSLQPSTYSYKESYQKSMHVSNKPQFGFMAQELQTVLPELVSENKHPGETKEDPEISFLGINYIGLIPILTAGIQEQQEQIDTLEAKIELQNQTIASLVSRLQALEDR